MSKFMFKPARRLLSSFIPYMSATLNTLFGIVLVNLSKDFLNILFDSELRISKLIPLLNRVGKKRVSKIFESTKNMFSVITISS